MDIYALIRREIERAPLTELESYLVGAAHDATVSAAHRTVRFCQSDSRWLELLGFALERLGKRSWIYREGARRKCWVVESTWRVPSGRICCPSAYCRGYFDAEGGIPSSSSARFYIQLVQKDFADLGDLRRMLQELGIECGTPHNPSARVDPEYWRFYVLSSSRRNFCEIIRSWHPRKRELLEERLLLMT